MPALSNDLYVGGTVDAPLYHFTNARIESGTMAGIFSVDVVGDQLSVDQITPTVRWNKDTAEVFSPKNVTYFLSKDGMIYSYGRVMDLSALPCGTPVWWYNDARQVCKVYLERVERVAQFFWRLRCVSVVGVLGRQNHAGGMYSGENFAAVLADIMGGAPYSVSEGVAALPVYGWLPYATRRRNLHQLIFPYGVSIRKDANGDPSFEFLSAVAPASVGDERVAYGGSVTYDAPATGVQVTEHSFVALATDEEVTLYDNTQSGTAAVSETIRFSYAPIHSLAASAGLTVVESGVNYAIVSGLGTLTGKRYSHVERVVTRSRETADRTNIKRVANMTLVSALNAEGVAERVLDYYSAARTIRSTIQLQGERTGDALRLTDPFGDPITAFLAEMTVNASTDLAANCTLIEGYTPSHSGTDYDAATVYAGEATLVVPDGGGRIVLIGGGEGGQSGADGRPGGRATVNDLGEGGEGGEPGTPGRGGRILVANIPAGTYTLKSGVGGVGGERQADGSQGDGALGTATELYDADGVLLLSSALGSVSSAGYLELISGALYAAVGDSGVQGGKGGKPTYLASLNGYAAEDVTFDGQTWLGGANGSRRVVENGSVIIDDPTYTGTLLWNQGGGGGAAVGANGGDAGMAGYRDIDAGSGGSAIPAPAQTVYGSGGMGGHGGGGGGAGGVLGYEGRALLYGSSTAGTGGRGGSGAPGCAILYTKGAA